MAKSRKLEIRYHHVTSDPTNFQVDDVLVCIADTPALVVGQRYKALGVTRRKNGPRVATHVIVCDENLNRLEVLDPDRCLRRTRVVAEILESNGHVRTHNFPDAHQLQAWCALARVAPYRVSSVRYEVAEAMPAANSRFTAMCVPGELDDGSDASWYVYDLLFCTSDKVGDGPQARSLAVWEAREANRQNQDASEPSPAATPAEVAS